MEEYTIQVEPQLLMSASEDITRKTKTVEGTFFEMRTKVQQTSAFWIGDAAELHRSLFDEQLPAMESIVNRFLEQAKKLKQIATNYAAAQSTVVAVVEDLPYDAIV